MSCAELMYQQSLASGFPYHPYPHQRPAADTYYASPTPVHPACGDYHVQGAVDSTMLQPSSPALPRAPLTLPSPCATPRHHAHTPGAASSSSSSSLSSSSPVQASSSTLSPPAPYFPSSSSAFASRPFPPAAPFPPPSPSAPSSSLSSSYSSTLKRPAPARDDLHDVTVPKKTRYVTSNCVLLTYHDKETSSEVDEHFSKALSSSPCSYGAGATRSVSTDSPPMCQRNFPPSFWAAGPQPGSYPGGGGMLGEPLYPLPPAFLPSLHTEPWTAFPFVSPKATLNYYPYTRSPAYPDPHPLSASYGSMATGGNCGRLGSNYGSLLLPTSSARPPARLPSATITSTQCASGDPTTGRPVPGPDSSLHETGRDLHWF